MERDTPGKYEQFAPPSDYSAAPAQQPNQQRFYPRLNFGNQPAGNQSGNQADGNQFGDDPFNPNNNQNNNQSNNQNNNQPNSGQPGQGFWPGARNDPDNRNFFELTADEKKILKDCKMQTFFGISKCD